MKRLICTLLSVMLLCVLAVPTMAAGEKIAFTSDSSFIVGGTVKVDKYKTFDNIIANGSSEEYNAFLEGNVQYFWMRNGTQCGDGMNLTLTESDVGCEIYCMAALYSDADRTMQCGTIYSPKFTVSSSANTPALPQITTADLPNGTVGEAYYKKLDCTDPDAAFSLFRSTLPDGLNLTQHGEIEGTPTKEGTWFVVIMVTPEGGAEYANTKEFEITIEAPAESYSLEIMELPTKLVYTSGEKLDLTGLWVRIYTPEGFIDSRNGQYLTYSQNPLVTVGEQKIKLTYEDAFEIFIVTVKEAEPMYTLEIVELPKKLVYTSGEKLDLTGLWVRIHTTHEYLDSHDGQYLTYTQKPLVTVGEQKIKLTYEDAFEIFIVTVKEAPPHVHKDELTPVAAAAAGCTADGHKAYYQCSCGKYFEDAAAATEITDLAAWKTGAGKVPGGHTYGDLVKEVPAIHTATELTAGKKAHYLCTKCGTCFTAEKVATTEAELVIPAPVHAFTTVNGYQDAQGHANTCACGAHDALVPHTPNIPAATETEDQLCSTCGYLMAQKTGHLHINHLTKVEAKPAGCTEDGNTEYYKCSCEKFFRDAAAAEEITDKNSVTIPAAHTYGELVNEVPAVHTATELKAGKKAHYLCTKCGACFTADKVATAEAELVIPAPVHTPDIPAATVTQEQKCSVCGYLMAAKLDPPATVPTAPPATDPAAPIQPQKTDGMPWWGTLLIAVAAAGAGGCGVFLVLKKKK